MKASDPAGEKIRVIVADDHPVFREGVVRGLAASDAVEVLAETDDGAEALALIRKHRPDVALLDHQMPSLHGAEVAATVLREGMSTRVLLVSANDDPTVVYHALQQGAAGYLSKESTRAEILQAVIDCASGIDVVAPKLASRLAVEIRRRAEPPGQALSSREREVLKMLGSGQTVAAIAAELFLAPSTVKTHVQRLYEKLGVSGRGAAVAEAMRRGLLD
jgi:two-component system nitrate/nitrite response regulator NarL